jgi:hypothetical protein
MRDVAGARLQSSSGVTPVPTSARDVYRFGPFELTAAPASYAVTGYGFVYRINPCRFS